MLNEGIAHLDSLEISKFMNIARKIVNHDKSIELSVKIDGSANLGVGLDENGRLYFNRAMKGDLDFKRSPNDYPKKPMYNALRSAVAVISQNKDLFEKYMNPGDFTSIEVLFESYPNAIQYGNNTIVIHEEKFNYLSQKIKKLSGKIDLYFYDFDSKKIKRINSKVEYDIRGKEVIKSDAYKVSISGELDELEKFLNQKNVVFNDLSNFQVLGLKAIGSYKEKIKDEKQRLEDELKSKKTIIKSSLEDILSQIPASEFAPKPVFDKGGNNIEGSWPEGIVIKDLETGELTKIVSIFPVVNKFLWHYREIADKGVGPAGEFVVGIMGNFKKRIAEIFKIKSLNMPGIIAHINKKYASLPLNQKLLFYLKDNKFKFSSINLVISKTLESIKKAKTELIELRNEFDREGKNKTLDITRNKFKRTIKYDQIHIRKTFETFLMLEEELDDLEKNIRNIRAKTEEGKSVQLLRLFLGNKNLKKMSESKNFKTLKNIIKRKLSKLLKEEQGKSIGVILGRFEPPTSAHFEIIKKAQKENDYVYIFLAGNKVSKDNPFSFNIRKKILSYLPKKNFIVKQAKEGFLPKLIDEFVNKSNISLINVYAGSDRIKGYEQQFEKYWNNPIVVKINEIKRNIENSVSGTKVRQSLVNNDYLSFSQMISQDILDREKVKIFNELRKIILKFYKVKIETKHEITR